MRTSVFIGHDDIVGAVRNAEPNAENFDPDDDLKDYREHSKFVKLYRGRKVQWVGTVGKMVKIPASNVLFMEGNLWNFEHASAIYQRILHGDARLRAPAGRVHRVDAAAVAQAKKYAAAGELEYQLGMERPWTKADIGTYYAQLVDGNHRASAAIAAGEPFIWVYVGEDSLPNVRKKNLNGEGAAEPPARHPGSTRLNCPWWWCVWFRDVLPAIHDHPKRTPPWWKHMVDLSPAAAKRIMEIAHRSVQTGDRALLPPPDLLEEAVRHALITESGGTLAFPDQRVKAEMRRLLRRDET